MSLREQLSSDLGAVFLRADEFAEPMRLNGREALVIEDTEQLTLYRAAGLCSGERLLYCGREVFDRLPRAGERLLLEARACQSQWVIERCREDGGLLELTLRGGR